MRPSIILLLFIYLLIVPSCSNTPVRTDREESSSPAQQKEALRSGMLGDGSYGDYYYEDFGATRDTQRSESESSRPAGTSSEATARDKESDAAEKRYTSRSGNRQSGATGTRREDSKERESEYRRHLPESREMEAGRRRENQNEEREYHRHLPQSGNTTTGRRRQQHNSSANEERSGTRSRTNTGNDAAKDSGATENDSSNTVQQQEIVTYQFSLSRRRRLKSFDTINGPTKDYHLIQSPMNSTHYYFLSDRKFSSIERHSSYEALLRKKQMYGILEEELPKPEGTGFLEIMVADARWDSGGDREIFSNPRFTNIMTFHRGDKLGFTLYFDKSNSRMSLIYSAGGDLYSTDTTDGITFSTPKAMTALNSSGLDRDPSISPDGRYIVFASNRRRSRSVSDVELYYCFRENINSPFSNPQRIEGTLNAAGELFPSIYQSSLGTFVFFMNYKKHGGSYQNMLFSVQLTGGTARPPVRFSDETDTPFKYITVSYAPAKGLRIMSSYPVNGYDLFRMDLEGWRQVRLRYDSESASYEPVK